MVSEDPAAAATDAFRNVTGKWMVEEMHNGGVVSLPESAVNVVYKILDDGQFTTDYALIDLESAEELKLESGAGTLSLEKSISL